MTRIVEETHCILKIKTRIVENTLYPEKFVVVGSWQEQRYQQALVIIMYR
jgi:hypothetical protein